MPRSAPRESDEQILRWLEMADAKIPVANIAEIEGIAPGYIKSTLYKVRKADREAHA